MAVVNGTVAHDGPSDGCVEVITWANMANGDTGAAANWAKYQDRSVTFTGTFGTGGTIKLQGSNDGTNWFDLTDPQGNAISKTAAGLEQVQEATLWVRPNVTAGDGTTSLTAILFMRKN